LLAVKLSIILFFLANKKKRVFSHEFELFRAYQTSPKTCLVVQLQACLLATRLGQACFVKRLLIGRHGTVPYRTPRPLRRRLSGVVTCHNSHVLV
jgi:hypothetical protein